MMDGKVVAIFTTPEACGDLISVGEAALVAGRGIVGDRYHAETGTFSKQLPGPDHELTLIEAEEIVRFNTESGLALDYSDMRRNIVTEGVSLNDLVDVEFKLGEVTVRGIRLCEPCAHLAALVGSEVLSGLVHRAGLRACILEGGYCGRTIQSRSAAAVNRVFPVSISAHLSPTVPGSLRTSARHSQQASFLAAWACLRV